MLSARLVDLYGIVRHLVLARELVTLRARPSRPVRKVAIPETVVAHAASKIGDLFKAPILREQAVSGQNV